MDIAHEHRKQNGLKQDRCVGKATYLLNFQILFKFVSHCLCVQKKSKQALLCLKATPDFSSLQIYNTIHITQQWK